MNTRKLFNLFVGVIFVFSLLGTPGSATAQGPSPIIWGVIASSNGIHGLGWPGNATLWISIDDPSTPQDPDSTTTQNTDASGSFSHQSQFDISVGSVVSVTDGSTTKEVRVTNFEVIAFDANTGILSGIGTPNANAAVWITDPAGGNTSFVIDSSGHWQVDLTEVADITPWSRGFAVEQDADGDGTWSNWPPHYIQASINRPGHSIEGYDWNLGSSIALTVDNPGNGAGIDLTDVQIAELNEWNENEVQFDLGDFKLEPGALVTLTDGMISQSHTVAYLDITDVDVEADLVFGKAAAGSIIQIHFRNQAGQVRRHVNADQDGNWMADFSTPGPGNDEPALFDIQPGSGFGSRQYDDAGNSTWLYWVVPDPQVIAYPEEDVIAATDFWPGTPVTIAVDDPANGVGVDITRTGIVDTETGGWNCQTWWGYCFVLDLWGEFDVQAGQLITITDGTRTRSHVVTPLEITAVDNDRSTVSGIADPLSDVYLDAWPCAARLRHVVADANGSWFEDFSIPGDEDFEQATCDFTTEPFTGTAYERSGDGETWVGWYVPNITFSAFPAEDHIKGHNWPPGAPLQIEIDDPATPVNPDYTGYAEPNEIIDFSVQYDMKPGDIVTVTNGTITKIHIITEFSITFIDVDTDIVFGLAEPGSEIDSWICDDYGCAERWVTADQDGHWSANFSVLDNSTVGYGTYDFTPGTGVEASQEDEDGDKTVVAMDLPFDSDGDGIADDMDACPGENASGYDADENGCIDTAQGLRILLQNMPADEVAPNLKNPLLVKINNAIKSLGMGNVNAAINQLEAFIQQVEAQRGKKVSDDAANLLISYAQNVIAGIQ